MNALVPLLTVAAEINARFRKAAEMDGEANNHRIAAGLLLIEARQRVDGGEASDRCEKAGAKRADVSAVSGSAFAADKRVSFRDALAAFTPSEERDMLDESITLLSDEHRRFIADSIVVRMTRATRETFFKQDREQKPVLSEGMDKLAEHERKKLRGIVAKQEDNFRAKFRAAPTVNATVTYIEVLRRLADEWVSEKMKVTP